MKNSDPRTVDNVIASRYTLTAKGCETAGGHLWTFGNTNGTKICKACGTCEEWKP